MRARLPSVNRRYARRHDCMHVTNHPQSATKRSAMAEGRVMPEFHKILIFMKRKSGTTVEQFRDHYESRHVPLCMKYFGPATKRYFRRYVDALPGIEPPYDVVTEVWIDDRDAFETVLKYAGQGVLAPEIVEDEQRFLDRDKTCFTWVTEQETDFGR